MKRRFYAEFTCSKCGKASKVRTDYRKKTTRCRECCPPPITRLWRGGKAMQAGRKYVYAPEHPNAQKKGYVAESRLVMTEFIGRPIKSKEVVHHVNGDVLDNSIDNLSLMNPCIQKLS